MGDPKDKLAEAEEKVAEAIEENVKIPASIEEEQLLEAAELEELQNHRDTS